MKKVGLIFSIIGGIFSLFVGVGLVMGGVLCILLSVPAIKEAIVQFVQSIEADVPFPIMEYLNYMIAGAIVSGVISIIYAVFFFIAGGISLKCHRNRSYIASIVFGCLTGFQLFILLGAIFGLIFNKKQEEPVAEEPLPEENA